MPFYQEAWPKTQAKIENFYSLFEEIDYLVSKTVPLLMSTFMGELNTIKEVTERQDKPCSSS